MANDESSSLKGIEGTTHLLAIEHPRLGARVRLVNNIVDCDRVRDNLNRIN
jgi:hypothetical protein